MGSDVVQLLREARWLRLRLARTSWSFFKALPCATKKARRGRTGLLQRSCGARGLREEGEQALSCKEPGGLFAACELKNAPFSGAFFDRARVLPREKDRLKKRGVRLLADACEICLAPTRRREEDVRRLRLESVVPRGRMERILRLGVRASLARTSGECRISQSLPRATKKARRGRAIPWRREEDSNLRTSHPRHTISNRAP